MIPVMRRRLPRLLPGGVLAAILASMILAVACGGGDNSDDAPATADATAMPTPLTTAPLDRIIIPAARVDAPIVVKSLDSAGVMQSPENGEDVAWYDFTARPGEGSNAVFSGHVDHITVGQAVFWDLNLLKPGDRIEIRYADGVSVRYAVTALQTFPAGTAPVDDIVGPKPADTVTLITCAGNFNRITGQYDDRLIVRAEKV